MPDTIFPFMCGICCKLFKSLVSYFDHFKGHQLNIINFIHNEKSTITGDSPAQLQSHNEDDEIGETISKVCSFKCSDCHNEVLGICNVKEHILLHDYLILTSNSHSSNKEKRCSWGDNGVNHKKTGTPIETEVFKSACGTINCGSANNEIGGIRSDSCIQKSSGEIGKGVKELNIEQSHSCVDRDNDSHHSASTVRDKKEKLLSNKSSISKVWAPEIPAAIKKFIALNGSAIDTETISRDDNATFNDGERQKLLTAKNHENVYECKESFTLDNQTDKVSITKNSSEANYEQNDTCPSSTETECKSDNKSNNEYFEPQPSTSSETEGDERRSNEDLIDIPTNDIIINKLEQDSENTKELHEIDDQLDESAAPNTVNMEEVSVNIVNVNEFDEGRQANLVDVECAENKKRKTVKRKSKCTSKTDDKLPCDMCGILFNKKNLHRHRLSHTDVKTHRCNICNKYFKTKDQLYSHKLFHNTRKDQMCHYCGKAFNNGPNLRQHVKIHTREKTLKCPFCPKMFRSNFILKDHVNRHSDNKPFICEHCGKSFRTGNELQRHARVHSNDRPHLCTFCDKAFKSRSNRIKHEKTHQS